MMFDAKMTKEQFQTKLPDLYNQVFEDGKLEGKNEATVENKAESQSMKEELSGASTFKKIVLLGQKMNKVNSAIEIAAKGESYEKSLEALIEAPVDTLESPLSKKLFTKTATKPVGNDEEEAEVTNWKEAKDHVAKKYNLTDKKEIVKKARREFPELATA